MQPIIVASAMSDLALKWLIVAIPIFIVFAVFVGLIVTIMVIVRRRYTSSQTFTVRGVHDKKSMLDALSSYFYGAGYRQVKRDDDEVVFVKDNRYYLVLGALLFLFFMLPGILYLVIFCKELQGRVYVQNISKGYIVSIDGPKRIIESARYAFESRSASQAFNEQDIKGIVNA